MRTVLLVCLLVAVAGCDSGQVPEGGRETAAVAESGQDRGGSAGTSPSAEPGTAQAGGAALPGEPDWRPVLAAVVARAGVPEPVTETATESQRALIARAADLRRLLSLRPDDVGTRISLADLYLRAHFPSRALAVLGEVLTGSPENVDALTLAAKCLLSERDAAGATALLARAAELDPKHLESRRLLALQHLEAGRASSARRRAEQVLERSPFDPSMQLVLGRSEADLERWEAAEVHLASAASGAPDSLAAHFLWARALRELGRDAEAERVEALHARLVRLEDLGLPGDWPAERVRLALAQSYRRTGEPELAEQELRVLLAAPRPGGTAVAEWSALLRERGRDPELELPRDFPHLSRSSD